MRAVPGVRNALYAAWVRCFLQYGTRTVAGQQPAPGGQLQYGTAAVVRYGAVTARACTVPVPDWYRYC